ncbi:MAG: BolA family transcriptional regulator [Alphaproteobacteria bacterium]|nr:BolA family transcriptional regulator [Alphaproteobacteria bacterium]
MFSADRIKALIEEALPDCTAVVIDDVGDGEHFSARVVSSAFAGRPLPAQHRMVYAALGERMGREIHALALRTFTPDTWAG